MVIYDNYQWLRFIHKNRSYKTQTIKEFNLTSKQFDQNLKSEIRNKDCYSNYRYLLIFINNTLAFVLFIIINIDDKIPLENNKLYEIKGLSIRLEGIYTYTDFRGKGLCKKAIKFATQWIKKNIPNFKGIYIHNVRLDNIGALKCYQSIGYKKKKKYIHKEYGPSWTLYYNLKKNKKNK